MKEKDQFEENYKISYDQLVVRWDKLSLYYSQQVDQMNRESLNFQVKFLEHFKILTAKITGF